MTDAKAIDAEPDSASGKTGAGRMPLNRLWPKILIWWRNEVRDDVDHTAVIARIASESDTTPRYVFMTMMSAGIAILGMLLSSPAVVIGAMLLSPLMSPILGAGFALASGKIKWLRISVTALAIGTVVAIGFTALLVLVSPLQSVTEEIASRTRPNLFDLMVALFSSLAGSYAMIRGREGTIVGVAIATALMPPLAAVGYGLATLNWTVFFGALALYVTNLLTIALSATVMARLYGFRTTMSHRQGWFQNIGIFVVFLALAVPLGLSLSQIALETNSQRIVANAITEEFGEKSRISQQDIDWNRQPLRVTATVFTPEFDYDADEKLQRALSAELGEDVEIAIEQFRVGADPGAAEQAELARADEQQKSDAERQMASALVERLAAIAGVQPADVTVDREARRVTVDAKPLPDLTLQGWRALEQRVASDANGWTVRLRPPVLALPTPAIEDGELTAEGKQAMTTIVWAALRLGIPVEIGGNEEALGLIAPMLEAANVPFTQVEQSGAGVTVRWADLPQ